jgi:hypothetical protein
VIFFEAEGIVALVIIAFWIWALFDCIATDSALCRNLPKGFWIILVLLLPDIGALAWLLLGRPQRAGWRPGSTDYSAPRRPIGIEDSPRYTEIAGVTDRQSEELDRRLDDWEKQQRAEGASNSSSAADPPAAPSPRADLDAWEAELAAREDEIRRRELELRERDLDERGRGLDEPS